MFEACDGYCRCNDEGRFDCNELCTSPNITCAPLEKKVTIRLPSPITSRCTCEVQKCVKVSMKVPPNEKSMLSQYSTLSKNVYHNFLISSYMVLSLCQQVSIINFTLIIEGAIEISRLIQLICWLTSQKETVRSSLP